MPFFNDAREHALHQHVMSQDDRSKLQGNPKQVLEAIHAHFEHDHHI